jgi:hypothetical protein
MWRDALVDQPPEQRAVAIGFVAASWMGAIPSFVLARVIRVRAAATSADNRTQFRTNDRVCLDEWPMIEIRTGAVLAQLQYGDRRERYKAQNECASSMHYAIELIGFDCS